MIPQHVRNSDFFGSKRRFKQFKDDVDLSLFKQITDVQLQITGYGHFERQAILQNFCRYTSDLLSYGREIKVLKISISGFELVNESVLQGISYSIVKNTRENIKCLWFHTAHLENCALEDFQAVLGLINELSHVNFQEISLQFSEWRFLKRQPSVNELESCFLRLIQNGSLTKINNQTFRLELSSWYYQQQYAQQFLRFKVDRSQALKLLNIKQKDFSRIQEENKQPYRRIMAFEEGDELQANEFKARTEQFHSKIEYFIKGLLELMVYVRSFQIDFRHWHSCLKMRELRKRLDNVTKKNTYQKSIISYRVGSEYNHSETELRMIFVM